MWYQQKCLSINYRDGEHARNKTSIVNDDVVGIELIQILEFRRSDSSGLESAVDLGIGSRIC